MTAAIWQAQNAQWMRLTLEKLRLQLERRALWLEQGSGDAGRTAWLLAEPDADAERVFFTSSGKVRVIDGMVVTKRDSADGLAREMAAAGRPPALVRLAGVAGLTALEVDLLLLAAAPAFDRGFAGAYAQMHGDGRFDFATPHLAMALFAEGPTERLTAGLCLMPQGRLRSLDLIQVDNSETASMLRRLAIDERVAGYLLGSNRLDVRLDSLLSETSDAPMSEGGHDAARSAAELITAELGRWQTINLVGPLDDGAEQMARQACAMIGLESARLDVGRLASRAPDDRSALVKLLGREALLAGLAFVVDGTQAEAGSACAAVIEELIEQLPATLYVLSAERWHGRGDAHVVFVKRPTRLEQAALWRMALDGHRHSINGEVESIVQQFDFGPAAIAAVVRRAAGSDRDGISGANLWRACREQAVTAMDPLARRISPSYSWDDIVVSDDVRLQLRELADQVSQRSHVYETWGFGAQLSRGRGITALFSGPSGTGKTMAAEILATHLDLDLFRIDLAGVVSKYVGETEKNLRGVFDEAERSGCILFFDEADALFGTRTEVRDSHDRYANVEINYLLQRMEEYGGLAILASNRRASMDSAFVRRLRFVIEFPFPGPDDRRRIWERVFPQQAAIDGVDFSFLSRLEMTGGSIRSAAVNAAFLAAAEEGPIRMVHIVRAVAREFVKLSKPISSADFGPYYAVLRR